MYNIDLENISKNTAYIAKCMEDANKLKVAEIYLQNGKPRVANEIIRKMIKDNNSSIYDLLDIGDD
jgi:hypothetical protein